MFQECYVCSYFIVTILSKVGVNFTYEDWNLKKKHQGHKSPKSYENLSKSLRSHTPSESLTTTALLSHREDTLILLHQTIWSCGGFSQSGNIFTEEETQSIENFTNPPKITFAIYPSFFFLKRKHEYFLRWIEEKGAPTASPRPSLPWPLNPGPKEGCSSQTNEPSDRWDPVQPSEQSAILLHSDFFLVSFSFCTFIL